MVLEMESDENDEPDKARVFDLSKYEREAGDSDMTMRELQEALKDDAHLRHAEAVEVNKEIMAKLNPALAKLRQSVLGPQTKAIRGAFQGGVKIPTLEISTPITSPAVTQAHLAENIARDQQEWMDEYYESMRQAQETKAERRRLEDDRAEQTLAVLESMDANLRQLSTRIASVDTEIQKGNKSSGRMAGWTLAVGVLTLIATVAGIGVTLWLSQ